MHPITTMLHWDSHIAWTKDLSNGPQFAMRNQQHWVFASADIVAHYSGAVQLREEDIILTEKKVNFSMGADNPMDKVRNRCSRVPTTCVEFSPFLSRNYTRAAIYHTVRCGTPAAVGVPVPG